jgi:hypothetical protein
MRDGTAKRGHSEFEEDQKDFGGTSHDAVHRFTNRKASGPKLPREKIIQNL